MSWNVMELSLNRCFVNVMESNGAFVKQMFIHAMETNGAFVKQMFVHII